LLKLLLGDEPFSEGLTRSFAHFFERSLRDRHEMSEREVRRLLEALELVTGNW
jgi:hypothetical protein